jgi:hypothetical protein
MLEAGSGLSVSEWNSLIAAEIGGGGHEGFVNFGVVRSGTVVGGALSIGGVASEGINGVDSVEADFGIRVVRLLLVNLRVMYPRGLGKKHLSRNKESDSNSPVAFWGIERATKDELEFTIFGEILCGIFVMIACGKGVVLLWAGSE